MKNLIIICSVLLINAALVITPARAQSFYFNRIQPASKKIASQTNTSEIIINSSRDYINKISTKIVREFFKNFKKAKKVTWIKISDGGYFAKFLTDSILTTIKYNHSGSWDYIFNEYTEVRMPASLRNTIKSKFFDFEITAIKEIKWPQEKTMYSVVIKRGNNFKILKISNNEMIVYGEFTEQEH